MLILQALPDLIGLKKTKTKQGKLSLYLHPSADHFQTHSISFLLQFVKSLLKDINQDILSTLISLSSMDYFAYSKILGKLL